MFPKHFVLLQLWLLLIHTVVGAGYAPDEETEIESLPSESTTESLTGQVKHFFKSGWHHHLYRIFAILMFSGLTVLCIQQVVLMCILWRNRMNEKKRHQLALEKIKNDQHSRSQRRGDSRQQERHRSRSSRQRSPRHHDADSTPSSPQRKTSRSKSSAGPLPPGPPAPSGPPPPPAPSGPPPPTAPSAPPPPPGPPPAVGLPPPPGPPPAVGLPPPPGPPPAIGLPPPPAIGLPPPPAPPPAVGLPPPPGPPPAVGLPPPGPPGLQPTGQPLAAGPPVSVPSRPNPMPISPEDALRAAINKRRQKLDYNNSHPVAYSRSFVKPPVPLLSGPDAEPTQSQDVWRGPVKIITQNVDNNNVRHAMPLRGNTPPVHAPFRQAEQSEPKRAFRVPVYQTRQNIDTKYSHPVSYGRPLSTPVRGDIPPVLLSRTYEEPTEYEDTFRAHVNRIRQHADTSNSHRFGYIHLPTHLLGNAQTMSAKSRPDAELAETKAAFGVHIIKRRQNMDYNNSHPVAYGHLARPLCVPPRSDREPIEPQDHLSVPINQARQHIDSSNSPTVGYIRLPAHLLGDALPMPVRSRLDAEPTRDVTGAHIKTRYNLDNNNNSRSDGYTLVSTPLRDDPPVHVPSRPDAELTEPQDDQGAPVNNRCQHLDSNNNNNNSRTVEYRLLSTPLRGAKPSVPVWPRPVDEPISNERALRAYIIIKRTNSDTNNARPVGHGRGLATPLRVAEPIVHASFKAVIQPNEQHEDVVRATISHLRQDLDNTSRLCRYINLPAPLRGYTLPVSTPPRPDAQPIEHENTTRAHINQIRQHLDTSNSGSVPDRRPHATPVRGGKLPVTLISSSDAESAEDEDTIRASVNEIHQTNNLCPVAHVGLRRRIREAEPPESVHSRPVVISTGRPLTAHIIKKHNLNYDTSRPVRYVRIDRPLYSDEPPFPVSSTLNAQPIKPVDVLISAVNGTLVNLDFYHSRPITYVRIDTPLQAEGPPVNVPSRRVAGQVSTKRCLIAHIIKKSVII